MYHARILYTCLRTGKTSKLTARGLTLHDACRRAGVWMEHMKRWNHCRLNMAGIENDTAQPGQPRRWLYDSTRGMWDVIEYAPEAAAPKPTTAQPTLFASATN